jgi:uncharacterized protein (DUF58 family)
LHKSPFHGFSVEFAEHRLYNQGDSLRHIDWRVYGRTDKLFVKRFEEETNLRCCLVLDTSSSMYFPQDEKKLSKLQFSCIAAAALLQLLKRQLDAASLALFDEGVHYLSACRSANSHYRLLTHQLQQLLDTQPGLNKKTEAAAVLHQIAEQMHKRSLIVLFSDMFDDAENLDALFAGIQHLKYNKHEVIIFHVMDGKQEINFEFDNRPYEFIDMESGDKVKLQASDIKEQYLKQMADFQQVIADKCHRYHIEYVQVDLSQPMEQVLYAYLLKRNKLL